MKLQMAALAVLCAGIPAWGETYLVLPFLNASRTANLEWVGESVSESIREALSSRGLVTLGREDRLEAYRRLGVRAEATLTRATLIKIGQALDADEVIYGDFEFQPPAANITNAKGSLKITAHVLAMRVLKQGPEFSEMGSIEDLAAEQTRLAWQTLRYLDPKAAPSEAEFLQQRPQVRVDALESYTRGLLATGPDQKSKLFNQAARLDPSFSQAHFQLGMLAYSRKDCKNAAESLQKVALSDVGYRQAMFYLGICRYQTGNFAGAQAAFEVVVKTVPLNEVYNNLGAAQSRLDRPEALDTFAKALEGDSSDPLYHFNVGYVLWRQGKFEAAAERFRAVLDRDKQDTEATLMLGKCLKRVGPQSGDSPERMERLKSTYEESAYWQLKAVLQPEKP